MRLERFTSTTAAFAWMLISSQPSGAAPSTTPDAPEDRIARYVNIDGGFELIIDRDKRMSTSTPFPKEGERTPEGRIITDSIGYEYGDCSTTKVVCADFDDFVLAVPRQPGDTPTWEHDGWTFMRTACLDYLGKLCVRYVAIFRNVSEDREGGFVYSSERGIEMHFDSKVSRREPRQIYVLASKYGLLHDGRP